MTTSPLTEPTPPSSSAAESLPDANTGPKPRSAARPASTCANGNHEDREPQVNVVAVELLFCAAFLDDTEKLRIATQNRLRAFAAEGFDADIYLKQLDALLALEHEATLALQRAVRRHPLGAWIKRTVGVGEKQGARLIAAIGDISYNHAEGRPRRGPAELWAYCGLHTLPASDHPRHESHSPPVAGGRNVAAKRRKGVQANWNAEAKMRAFLVAEACLKQKARSPYGPVYDHARANWTDRETTDLHKHHHALRLVAKAVLKDLFLEARRVGA